MTTEICFFALKSKKEKVVLDRGQNNKNKWLVLVVVVCTTTMFLFVEVFWCPCMAINVINSVQYNDGLLPDIILLTQ